MSNTDPVAGKVRCFRASAKGWSSVTRDTPRAAAEDFFKANPRARKCSVSEGFKGGAFFTVIYGPHEYPGESGRRRQRTWREVTKGNIGELPVEAVKPADPPADGPPIPEPEKPHQGPKLVPYCPKCGGVSIVCDAAARWDVDTQRWEVSHAFEQTSCDDCNAEFENADWRQAPA